MDEVPRRRVLKGAALLAGTAAAGRAASQPTSNLPPNVPEWMKTQGAPVLSPPYGLPSPFEKGVVRIQRTKTPTQMAATTLTPLQDLSGIITPNGLHFERDHGGAPAIDPAQHRLMVHGLVERPLIFTMEDLTRFPSVSRLHFIECSGNGSYEVLAPDTTAQVSRGLISCCEWTGVLLSTVLNEAGVKPGAAWILAEGADAAAVTRSVPMEKAMDDAILAYAQNGERLRPEQGYPLRLLLPGYEGNMNIKWLRRLKVGDQPFQTREETSKYSDLMPDGTARQFTFVMEANSIITFPSGGQKLQGPGFYEISGLAWSGRGAITGVEVSTDGGHTWRRAALQEPVLTKCLTRFRLPWTWDGASALIMSRSIDETRYVQPTRAELVAVRGVNSYYHYNAIQPWQVAGDGSVTYVA
ncbi:MAG TPA: sulfite dehydrogenase [Caulobacteraceae bacterium]|jgi:sulfane dehydrogenase subunit SoxC